MSWFSHFQSTCINASKKLFDIYTDPAVASSFICIRCRNQYLLSL